MNLLWQNTLSLLEQDMIRPSFETWIKVLQPISFENGCFVLGTNRHIVKEWVETRYLSLIRKSLEAIIDQPVLVSIDLMDQEPTSQTANREKILIQAMNEPAIVTQKSNFIPPIQRHIEDSISPLNPKYTFDSFVIGNSNRFAHAAALAVAEVPAKVYNPFFIYGGVGLGKTHLMHAIGHRISTVHPSNKVLYISSEKFTNDFINAIMSGHPDSFRNRYRNIDVLLIDDIQFLAKKEQTQEEFFHTFNALH